MSERSAELLLECCTECCTDFPNYFNISVLYFVI